VKSRSYILYLKGNSPRNLNMEIS